MIRGKVARVLDERSLIINRGQRDDVQLGMKFAVLEATPIDVVDPDTGEPLGAVPREKVRVKVVLLEDNLSICETYEMEQMSPATFDVQEFFLPRRRVVTFEAAEYAPPLTREERIVRVGDPVRELLEERSVARPSAQGGLRASS